jgi:hypothetical protein
MNDYRELAWPSVGRIANKCGLGERAVQINLKQICEKGYLVNNGRSNLGTNMYAICTPALDAPPHMDALTPAPDAPELTKELINTIPIGNGAFSPPSIQDVEDYTSTRSTPIDSERFVDFYQSKGWLIGKNKMKDWKAAVRNWERGNGENRAKTGSTGNQRRLSATERVKQRRYGPKP